MTTHRSEKDSMGAIDVPADKLWGAQTQRSLLNFDISGERQPREPLPVAIGEITAAHSQARDRPGSEVILQRGVIGHDGIVASPPAAFGIGPVSVSQMLRFRT